MNRSVVGQLVVGKQWEKAGHSAAPALDHLQQKA